VKVEAAELELTTVTIMLRMSLKAPISWRSSSDRFGASITAL
jgi:hypothetical protein